MSEVRPWEALEKVAKAIPEFCRENVVIIGSLAVGYAFFGKKDAMAVRTKDIDCLIRPFQVTVDKGQAITRKLLDAGWDPKQDGDFSRLDTVIPCQRISGGLGIINTKDIHKSPCGDVARSRGGDLAQF